LWGEKDEEDEDVREGDVREYHLGGYFRLLFVS